MIARIAALIATLFISLTSVAFAQDPVREVQPTDHLPTDGSYGMREPASPFAEEVLVFHDIILMPIMVGISLLIMFLLLWLVIRYNKKANPVAAQFSHNTTVEVLWTLVPVLILLFISLFSFDLLYLSDRMPDGQVNEYASGTTAAAVPNAFSKARMIKRSSHIQVELIDEATTLATMLSAADDYDVAGFGEEELIVTLKRPVPEGSIMRVTGGRSRVGKKPFLGVFGEDTSSIIPAPSVTIKATGFQWGWTYNYPDFGDFEFDALIAPRETVAPELYRFSTTNDIVVPVRETVRILTTGRDVIHSWAMPSFAVKIDAVPGRLNETWFYADNEGTYYGQCSEICGIDHAFMPISVRVVSRAEFETWVDERRVMEDMEPLFPAEKQLATTGMTVAEAAMK